MRKYFSVVLANVGASFKWTYYMERNNHVVACIDMVNALHTIG